MSTELNEISTEIKTFEDVIPTINDKYFTILNCLIEKFKYHEELIGHLEADLKLATEKLSTNKYQIINIITDNFLFCIEQISDYNSDYFIYQKEKIQKKNGKVYKNKLPKLGSKTLLKNILREIDSKSANIIFKSILDLFQLLLVNVDETVSFNEDYIQYVKDNFNENKNFSKMIMVFDNINNIMNSRVEELEEISDHDNSNSEDEKETKETKKSKKNKKNKNKKEKDEPFGMNFMNGLENTKIAQLAKNISEKINMDDFPILTDPTKLLSSLSNPTENGNGVQDLLKFVIGEVEGAFKNNNMKESDLVSEAQNIMGQFSNMSGFDPISILKDGNIDMNQFSDIFSNLGKK